MIDYHIQQQRLAVQPQGSPEYSHHSLTKYRVKINKVKDKKKRQGAQKYQKQVKLRPLQIDDRDQVRGTRAGLAGGNAYYRRHFFGPVDLTKKHPKKGQNCKQRTVSQVKNDQSTSMLSQGWGNDGNRQIHQPIWNEQSNDYRSPNDQKMRFKESRQTTKKQVSTQKIQSSKNEEDELPNTFVDLIDMSNKDLVNQERSESQSLLLLKTPNSQKSQINLKNHHNVDIITSNAMVSPIERSKNNQLPHMPKSLPNEKVMQPERKVKQAKISPIFQSMNTRGNPRSGQNSFRKLATSDMEISRNRQIKTNESKSYKANQKRSRNIPTSEGEANSINQNKFNLNERQSSMRQTKKLEESNSMVQSRKNNNSQVNETGVSPDMKSAVIQLAQEIEAQTKIIQNADVTLDIAQDSKVLSDLPPDPKVVSGMNILEQTEGSKEEVKKPGRHLIRREMRQREAYPTKKIIANINHPLFIEQPYFPSAMNASFPFRSSISTRKSMAVRRAISGLSRLQKRALNEAIEYSSSLRSSNKFNLRKKGLTKGQKILESKIMSGPRPQTSFQQRSPQMMDEVRYLSEREPGDYSRQGSEERSSMRPNSYAFIKDARNSVDVPANIIRFDEINRLAAQAGRQLVLLKNQNIFVQENQSTPEEHFNQTTNIQKFFMDQNLNITDDHYFNKTSKDDSKEKTDLNQDLLASSNLQTQFQAGHANKSVRLEKSSHQVSQLNLDNRPESLVEGHHEVRSGTEDNNHTSKFGDSSIKKPLSNDYAAIDLEKASPQAFKRHLYINPITQEVDGVLNQIDISPLERENQENNKKLDLNNFDNSNDDDSRPKPSKKAIFSKNQSPVKRRPSGSSGQPLQQDSSKPQINDSMKMAVEIQTKKKFNPFSKVPNLDLSQGDFSIWFQVDNTNHESNEEPNKTFLQNAFVQLPDGTLVRYGDLHALQENMSGDGKVDRTEISSGGSRVMSQDGQKKFYIQNLDGTIYNGQESEAAKSPLESIANNVHSVVTYGDLNPVFCPKEGLKLTKIPAATRLLNRKSIEWRKIRLDGEAGETRDFVSRDQEEGTSVMGKRRFSSKGRDKTRNDERENLYKPSTDLKSLTKECLFIKSINGIEKQDQFEGKHLNQRLETKEEKMTGNSPGEVKENQATLDLLPPPGSSHTLNTKINGQTGFIRVPGDPSHQHISKTSIIRQDLSNLLTSNVSKGLLEKSLSPNDVGPVKRTDFSVKLHVNRINQHSNLSSNQRMASNIEIGKQEVRESCEEKESADGKDTVLKNQRISAEFAACRPATGKVRVSNAIESGTFHGSMKIDGAIFNSFALRGGHQNQKSEKRAKESHNAINSQKSQKSLISIRSSQKSNQDIEDILNRKKKEVSNSADEHGVQDTKQNVVLFKRAQLNSQQRVKVLTSSESRQQFKQLAGLKLKDEEKNTGEVCLTNEIVSTNLQMIKTKPKISLLSNRQSRFKKKTEEFQTSQIKKKVRLHSCIYSRGTNEFKQEYSSGIDSRYIQFYQRSKTKSQRGILGAHNRNKSEFCRGKPFDASLKQDTRCFKSGGEQSLKAKEEKTMQKSARSQSVNQDISRNHSRSSIASYISSKNNNSPFECNQFQTMGQTQKSISLSPDNRTKQEVQPSTNLSNPVQVKLVEQTRQSTANPQGEYQVLFEFLKDHGGAESQINCRGSEMQLRDTKLQQARIIQRPRTSVIRMSGPSQGSKQIGSNNSVLFPLARSSYARRIIQKGTNTDLSDAGQQSFANLNSSQTNFQKTKKRKVRKYEQKKPTFLLQSRCGKNETSDARISFEKAIQGIQYQVGGDQLDQYLNAEIEQADVNIRIC